MDERIWYMISFMTLLVGFIVAKWFDPYFRARIMRRALKKDYGILAIVSKDAKNILKMVVNFEKDTINIAGKVWVITQHYVYREDKKERGFVMGKAHVKWEEGVPAVYVEQDSIKPLDFFSDRTPVKPEEIGSFLSAWVNNQLAKNISQVKNQQILIFIVILLCGLTLAIAYMNLNAITEVRDGLGQLAGRIGGEDPTLLPEGATIVIDATGQNSTLPPVES